MKMAAMLVVTSVVAISSTALADAVDVTASESIVHTAPFDVAPAMARVHLGDKLDGEQDTQGGWLRVTLPDGRHGFLRAADARLTAPPPTPVAPAPPPAAVSAPAPVPPPVAPPAPAVASAVVATQAAAPAEGGPLLVGVAFELFPAGTLTSGLPSSKTVDEDAQLTAGLAPFLDVPVTRWLALGISPQFVPNVRVFSATQSWTEYDVRARLTLLDPVSSSSRLFARLSPGYSVLAPPSGALPTNVSDPAGFVVDFAVGAQTALGPDGLLLVDLGYQIGFQGTSIDGQDVDSRTRFLHVGFGVALGL